MRVSSAFQAGSRLNQFVVVDAAMQIFGYLQLLDYSAALPEFKCDALSLFAAPDNKLLLPCIGDARS